MDENLEDTGCVVAEVMEVIGPKGQNAVPWPPVSVPFFRGASRGQGGIAGGGLKRRDRVPVAAKHRLT
jgi:hypothetical protein